MRIVPFCLLAAVATTGEAQAPASDSSTAGLVAALEEFVPIALRFDGAPGITIALGRGDRLVWQQGFGWADVARKIPLRADAVTRAGSMSKPYTGTAIMQLVDRGVLGLDEPVSRYVHDFAVTNPLGDRPITIRDLLTHTSGLSEADARYAELSQTESIADYLKSVFARSDDKGPDGKPVRWVGKVGERSSYSNIGVTLLGYIVAVTNPDHLSYPDYVHRNIQEALGMRVSHFPPDVNEGSQPAALSTGYAAIGDVLLPAPRLWTPVQPAGTLYATAAEHLRLIQMFLGGGTYQGTTILSRASAAAMLTPTVEFAGGHLGLIWMLSDEAKPYLSFSHAGAYMYGWTNQGAGFPHYGVGVVTAVNRWPMQSYLWGTRVEQLVTDFVGRWLAFEESNPGVRVPPRSWAWKRSYVIGLEMAQAYHGQLQARTRLTEARLTAMSRAVARPGGSLVGRWDPEGFRIGYQDMAPIATDSAAIAAFFGSRALKVHPAELALLFVDVGGRGGLPAP